MVSSLVAGTDFGMVLLWAVVLGAILKYVLTEGIGRWYMASGRPSCRAGVRLADGRSGIS
jgi:hypothetical protein